MRGRVEELAQGKITYNTPEIEIDTPLIEINISENENYEGSFVIKSSNSYNIKGVVYTSTYRMECLNSQFIGNEDGGCYQNLNSDNSSLSASINYKFNSQGLSEGETLNGSFYIISNGGGLNLPFVVNIQRKVMSSSMGRIRNLFHFTNLATSNWSEAYKLFEAPDFKNIFVNNDKRYKYMYLSLTKGIITNQCMEEFLIGINKKMPVEISLNEYSRTFREIKDSVQEKVRISKSTWGYAELNLSVDCDFIELNTSKLTTADFVGSSYNLEYIVNINKLHKGRNFGRINISAPYSEITFNVTVEQAYAEMNSMHKNSVKHQKKCLLELSRLYVAYRCKKVSTNPWAKECMEYVKKLNEIDENNNLYKLLKAHILFIEKKNYEAGTIVEKFDKGKNKLQSDVYAYYLFLKTYYSDKKQVNKAADEIRKLHQKDKTRWQLLLFLLNMDNKYLEGNITKYEKLEEQFNSGCKSPMMYAEAYRLIKTDPILIRKLSAFELQLVWWAVRQRLLTKEIIIQIARLAGKVKEFDSTLYKILTSGYEQFEDKEILSSICSMLIKGNKIESKYFKWYSYGVEKELRITRLYEYYMYSIPMDFEEEIPRAVLMYFIYFNNLDYKKTAFLYECVIKQRDTAPELFQSYRRYIDQFMLDQLLQKHINTKLAFIYETMLSLNVITPKLAQAISGIVFNYQLICRDKRIKSVIVVNSYLKDERIYPLSDGRAYINIYTDDYAIALLDSKGNRYTVSVDYELKNLMDEAFYVKKCYELDADSIEIKLRMCEQLIAGNKLENEHIRMLAELIRSELIRESYKSELRKSIIKYCFDNYEDDELTKYILNIDIEKLEEFQRCKAIEYLIIKGMYNEAYEWAKVYGYEAIELKKLVKLTSRIIYYTDYEEDKILLSMCIHAFNAKKYDEVILKYLVAFYTGALNIMENIYAAAMRFELDAYELAERILLQSIFTNAFNAKTEGIFSYYNKIGSRFGISDAYTVYNAYDYFINDNVKGEQIFDYIFREYLNGSSISDICKIAMLKHLASKDEYSNAEQEYIDKTLNELINRKIYFKFYENFNADILEAFCYEGKRAVEYRTGSGKRILIHYIIEDLEGETSQYEIEELNEVYDGIYVKLFTLFYGEKVNYYITEETEESNVLADKGEIVISELDINSPESRYEMLNEMLICINMHDNKTLHETMKKYALNSLAAESMFECM